MIWQIEVRHVLQGSGVALRQELCDKLGTEVMIFPSKGEMENAAKYPKTCIVVGGAIFHHLLNPLLDFLIGLI